VENISACKREKGRSLLTDCKYFKISLLEPEKELSLVSQNFNSFIIYLCESGKAEISSANGAVIVARGETLLIPAALGEYKIKPGSSGCRFLEITGKYQIPDDGYISSSE
ncbi:MAG: hypothetical protein PHU00_03710, partial [Bacteroidales bacterium]|nr:hypothetical protein [Bacteroidales bacterium]